MTESPTRISPQPPDANSSVDAQDFLILFGALSIVAGVGFIYWPAALIVAGCLCIVAVRLANR